MRLLQLHLKAVGPFTGVELDLSAGQHGLHLIYGPNEAGKTSALRALSHLLFGFPSRTPDDFIHPYDQLRVGGTLRHSDGEVLEIVRRKGNKNTLRDADDAATVAPERLERFLGGVDQDTFETLFGIDHARLKQAGEEIRTGQGQLGELLFAAGTGLAGLGQAQQRLQERLDALFKPRGQNQRINQALAEYRVSQDEIKRFQLPERGVAAARPRPPRGPGAGRIDWSSRPTPRAARSTGSIRVRDAIPLVARLRRLQGELEQLGDVVRLRDDFGSECREAQETLHLVVSTIEQARRRGRGAGRSARRRPSPPRVLLDAADEIEALEERLGAVDKALERPGPAWRTCRLEHEHQARGILRELGRSRRPRRGRGAAAPRRRAARSSGRSAKKFAALRARRDETRKAIARHEDQVGRLEREQADAGRAARRRPRSVAPSAAARKAGDLDARRDRGPRRVRPVPRSRRPSALEPAPGLVGQPRRPGTAGRARSSATLDRFEVGLAGRRARRSGPSTIRMTAEDEADRAARGAGPGPGSGAGRADRGRPPRRAQRAATTAGSWSALPGSPPRPTLRNGVAFVAEFAPADLADAFEQSWLRADAMADRLRREADRVSAQGGVARPARPPPRRPRSVVPQTARGRGPAGSRSASDWTGRRPSRSACRGGRPPSSGPGSGSGTRSSSSAEQARDARLAREPFETVARRAPHGPGAGPGRPWVSRCRILDDRPRRPARAGRGRARSARTAPAVAAARPSANRSTRPAPTSAAIGFAFRPARTSWPTGGSTGRSRWLGSASNPTPPPSRPRSSWTEIQDLFEALEQAPRLPEPDPRHRPRRRAVRRRRRRVLARRLAPDLDGAPADAHGPRTGRAAPRGPRRRRSGTRPCSGSAIGESRRLREAEDRARSPRPRGSTGSATRRLRRRPTTSPRPSAARPSGAGSRTTSATARTSSSRSAGGADAGAVRRRGRAGRRRRARPGHRPARSRARRPREGAATRVNQTIGAERVELARMDGGDRAAEAAETVQTTLARLQADVDRYAALKLAAAVLQRGIERYREKNQGPVLARASQLFADLTDGSFVRPPDRRRRRRPRRAQGGPARRPPRRRRGA